MDKSPYFYEVFYFIAQKYARKRFCCYVRENTIQCTACLCATYLTASAKHLYELQFAWKLQRMRWHWVPVSSGRGWRSRNGFGGHARHLQHLGSHCGRVRRRRAGPGRQPADPDQWPALCASLLPLATALQWLVIINCWCFLISLRQIFWKNTAALDLFFFIRLDLKHEANLLLIYLVFIFLMN